MLYSHSNLSKFKINTILIFPNINKTRWEKLTFWGEYSSFPIKMMWNVSTGRCKKTVTGIWAHCFIFNSRKCSSIHTCQKNSYWRKFLNELCTISGLTSGGGGPIIQNTLYKNQECITGYVFRVFKQKRFFIVNT